MTTSSRAPRCRPGLGGPPHHDLHAILAAARGAVIIRGDTIIGAGAILPLSQAPLPDRSLGTRHRAAIGLSQETDAVVIVVSEETSTISVAVAGRLTRNFTPAQVRDLVSGRPARTASEQPVAELPA